MRLLVHGDSIAATAPWPGDVVNRAVVGARVRDLLDQLDSTSADLTVVSVGVNDALDVWAPLQLDDLRVALRRLSRRSDRLLLTQPRLCLRLHPRAARPLLAARLAEVTKHLQATGLPMAAPRLPMWCWSRDGIHLNERGQRQLVVAVGRYTPGSASDNTLS